MYAASIVEALDPVDDIEPGLRARLVADAIDAFDFQGFKEAFHWRVIPAVCPSAHRLNHSIRLEEFPIPFTGVLTATIAVHDDPGARFSPTISGFQCVGDQIRFDSITHRPQPTILRLAKSITQAK